MGGLLRDRRHHSEAANIRLYALLLDKMHNLLFWSHASMYFYEGLLCDIST